MQNITTIIFDLGRVLVRIDTTGAKFGRLMRAMNVDPEKAFVQYWYAPEVQQFMTGKIGPETFYRIACARHNLNFTYGEFVESWTDLFHPMPGMEELFLRLSKRYRMGLLSDTDPLHWEQIRRNLPWLDTVKKPTLSFETGLLKPHPDVFAAAAADCRTAKEHCLFIDDLEGNVDGARYFGMPALHFPGAPKLTRELGELGIL